MLNLLLLVAFLSLVTWRVTRFVLNDTLIEELRSKVLGWLGRAPQSTWRLKLMELLTCPFCFSVWVAAAVTAGWDIYGSVPAPIAVWLAVAGGTMVVWRWVES